MTLQQIKRELIDAASAGVRDYLRTTRGANVCGAGSGLTSDGETILVQVHPSGYPYNEAQTTLIIGFREDIE